MTNKPQLQSDTALGRIPEGQQATKENTDDATHHTIWEPKRLLRLNAIVQPDGCLPIAASTWWAGVATGRFPKPVKLGPRITAWRAEDIQKLIEHGATLDDTALGGAK